MQNQFNHVHFGSNHVHLMTAHASKCCISFPSQFSHSVPQNVASVSLANSDNVPQNAASVLLANSHNVPQNVADCFTMRIS